MATKSKRGTGRKSKGKLHLLVSNKTRPAVSLKPGMKLNVVAVTLVEPTLKKAKASPARLCGGSSTCLALVEV